MTIRIVDQAPTTDPRPLSIEDLNACLALADDREWAHEDRKWEFLLRVGQGYGIDDAAGKLAASAVLTRCGGVSAISMVLVAARYEGQGLGKRIMRHTIAQAGDSLVTLYATAKGRPLYERLGFGATGTIDVFVGRFGSAATGITREATPSDLHAIVRVDAEVTGMDRAHVVGRLPDLADSVRVIERAGVITGYATAFRPMSAPDQTQIGPVIADNEADARALVADLAAAVDGTVRVDVPGDQPALAEWVAANGLKNVFTCDQMTMAAAALPGDRRRLYVPILQALG